MGQLRNKQADQDYVDPEYMEDEDRARQDSLEADLLRNMLIGAGSGASFFWWWRYVTAIY